MTSVRFTQEDRLVPTYCRICHARIPGRMKERNGGLCRGCAASESSEAKEIIERERLFKRAKNEAIKLHSTGAGECPECHSRNVAVIPITAANRIRSRLAWLGISCVLLAGAGYGAGGEVVMIPLAMFAGFGLATLFVALVLPSKNVLGKIRACNHCAHRWRQSTESSGKGVSAAGTAIWGHDI